MTLDETVKYVDRFEKNNKGLKDVTFLVYNSINDAYPRVPKEVKDELNLHDLYGVYYPADKKIVIIADKHKNTFELQATLNHEVYGHHGINHLTHDQKKQLLEKIMEYPNDSKIGKFRDALLSRGYGNLRDKPMMLAEETYAHLAELLDNKKEKFLGEVNINEINTGKDLMNVIRSVKGGIQSGELEHKITPETNDLQFKQSMPFNKLIDKIKAFKGNTQSTPVYTPDKTKSLEERIRAFKEHTQEVETMKRGKSKVMER